MNTLRMPDVMERVSRLPSLPSIVMELLTDLEQDETSTHELSQKISYDQSLTAKTLKVANSSFYGMSGKITTVFDAISVLGFQNLRSLVITSSMISGFSEPQDSLFHTDAFWRHSIATAICARAIAAQVGVVAEHAYTLGLLHDVGRLVLASQFSTQYSAAMAYRDQEDCALIDAERAVLHLDHAQVGEALARHWKFPATMQHAIANHHTPSDEDTMAILVQVADMVVHALDLAGQPNEMVPLVAARTWHGLQLSDAMLLDLFQKTENEFEALRLILGE